MRKIYQNFLPNTNTTRIMNFEENNEIENNSLERFMRTEENDYDSIDLTP